MALKAALGRITQLSAVARFRVAQPRFWHVSKGEGRRHFGYWVPTVRVLEYVGEKRGSALGDARRLLPSGPRAVHAGLTETRAAYPGSAHTSSSIPLRWPTAARELCTTVTPLPQNGTCDLGTALPLASVEVPDLMNVTTGSHDRTIASALGRADVSLLARVSVLELLAENSCDSIILTDADQGNITYCNKAFSRLTGYKQADVIGKSPKLLQGEGTDRKVIARLREALKSGGEYEGRAINYKKGGTPFIMYWRMVPVKVAGEVKAWVAIQREG